MRAGDIRQLLNTGWRSLDVQAGNLRFRSREFGATHSQSGFVINSREQVFIGAGELNLIRGECFHLCTGGSERIQAIHSSITRPPYSPISDWPQDLALPPDFFATGPIGATIGWRCIPSSWTATDTGDQEIAVWCQFTSVFGTALFFADDEIPLNVGLCCFPEAVSRIKATLLTDREQSIH